MLSNSGNFAQKKGKHVLATSPLHFFLGEHAPRKDAFSVIIHHYAVKTLTLWQHINFRALLMAGQNLYGLPEKKLTGYNIILFQALKYTVQMSPGNGITVEFVKKMLL